MRPNNKTPESNISNFLFLFIIVTLFTPPDVDKMIFLCMFIYLGYKLIDISLRTSVWNIPKDYWITALVVLGGLLIGYQVDIDMSSSKELDGDGDLE